MVPRENKNNAYSKFGWTNKEYYGIFRFGQNGFRGGGGGELKLFTNKMIKTYSFPKMRSTNDTKNIKAYSCKIT